MRASSASASIKSRECIIAQSSAVNMSSKTQPGAGKLTRCAPEGGEVRCGITVGEIVDDMTSGLRVAPASINDGCYACTVEEKGEQLSGYAGVSRSKGRELQSSLKSMELEALADSASVGRCAVTA